MSAERVIVRRGAYYDSVTLMLADAAGAAVDRELPAKAPARAEAPCARSLSAAARRHPELSLAFLSIPGDFAMGAAPAIVRFVGGGAEDALEATRAMYDISWSESRSYQIPALGFPGTPVGIDCREVVQTRVLPFVNTGIAHREPGVGQIGAGLVKPPMEAFAAAVRGLAGL